MSKEYPSYINTTEGWIVKYPKHWKLKRLKSIFAMRKERNNPIITTNILSLTAKQGVIPYAEKEGTGGNKPKDDMTKYNVAHENDLLVNCMNVVSGAAGVSKYFGAISPVYYALYPHENDNVWYYHHIFRLISFQRSLVGLGKGILMHESEDGTLTSVRMRISMDYLGNILLPVPPRTEQDQIVRFLDWKVSGINKLINLKKQTIQSLKDCRKALIDEAVLYGFHIEETVCNDIYWLKDTPVSWGIMPLKRLCQVNASVSDVAKKMSGEDEVTFLPMENVSVNADVDCSLKRKLDEVRTGYSSFAKGDVVVAKITPCFENGKGACLDCLDTNIGYGTTEFINLRPSEKILSRYLYLITMTRPFRTLGEKVMTGTAGQKRVPADYIKNFTLAIPSIGKQKEIIEKLELKFSEIDSLIKVEEEKIETLHELKNRLISDTVTGQIDVRDVEIPDFEFEDESVDTSEEDLEDEVTEEED